MTDTTHPARPVAPAPVARGALAPACDDWRIDPARVLSATRAVFPAERLEIVDETGSTNTDLMQRMRNLPRDAAEPGMQAVRVAYRQTAGRGRQGRSWHAERGRALTFSLACVLPRPLAGLAGLSLAVGTMLVEALRALPALAPGDAARIRLKWPNDILLDDDKLAGILVETAWSTPLATAAVIGVGINVRDDVTLSAEQATAAEMEPQRAALTRPMTPAALSRVYPNANLTETLAAALDALLGTIDRFAAEGFAPFRPRWNAFHAYAGRDVALIEQGVEVMRGTAIDVDESGQLLVATPQGVMPIATGDVSLRPVPVLGQSNHL
ncbi:BirA family biotin operon repressor/biotin-[acetyl-CoA-carboxylase] ligase [Trinickia symbiotica]|uniref:biotin--[biotin carboxyl-carrier protein] ligase n=1 Tax=Trinickia symbiotica TaxID=863227 RepID=A0A2N7X4H6_9BURK|nr:biotin--[acetyl-CoA-carboxylase] ligase [Trinickia symbiotica]PMS36481.1 biotin--[acetyl-CoA-carboxylase] ligase [Trinickia symbiotica]PPK44686.1 BirA family biotin operon repressor/biotin-[acetyl-CoA-carboxylase] ligase [Trinickia symbiotica]